MMSNRDSRWLALVVGVVLFAVGVVIEARRQRDFGGLIPDFLMYIGGTMVMWMAAKLFWTDDPPEWFAFFVFLGWLIILALTMNLIRRGVLL